jgi:hypothetical protein
VRGSTGSKRIWNAAIAGMAAPVEILPRAGVEPEHNSR